MKSKIPLDKISEDLKVNITQIKMTLGESSDLIVNPITINTKGPSSFACVYIESLVDSNILDSISALLDKQRLYYSDKDSEIDFTLLANAISGLKEPIESDDFDTLYTALLFGNMILLLEGSNRFFILQTSINKGRSIEEPTSQTVIRGSKEGFVESIETNTYLIRKRLRDPAIRLETLYIGSSTKTKVSLIYLKSKIEKDILDEVRNRLSNIHIDGLLESGSVEELIKDDKYSIFPTFLSSEKPDSVVANLLEGKIAILVDGTPYVLTAPAIMTEFFQSSEDYYHHYIISSMFRILRFISFALTMLVPATYIAITTFHQEVIPTPLLISIAAQREGVPFPALIEATLMELTFEILREAGVRMPRAIGPAISIVGALVLGQAAVDAGIISAAMVIVVSLTAISSFAIPYYEMSNAVRIVRFILMFLAGAFGLYGIFIGLILLILHLCKIKSVTVPYLSPIAPRIKGSNKDTFVRYPLWRLKDRPPNLLKTKFRK